ncbi:DNA topoisomerase 3 [Anaerotignum neopropionicum]|uniref:DNA topoisomerase n=1 Tax=Anaerotignum neopropionicum TaxID=36847 RepID=A0A136WGJ4_9FIRM|nr:type IA DNA topoisomerase [Anaerotignum neopropionicum]KXL53678.1 DNA topoisomerase 3 [Anaerotignum neopropionicum]
MRLVIAEKPSVAQSIAKVLGATDKKEGYLEGNGYFVSWCVGHLVGLAGTEKYNENYKIWDLKDLPIIPQSFEYEVSKGKEKQIKILCKLLNDPKVDVVINACDAGREGELIFRLVYQFAKCQKTMKRLWISSMEDSAIQKGFENLKDGTGFDLIYESAACRQKADWIVGINATRLFSLLYNQQLNVGRVMSPTLSMIVERNASIKAFRPTPFYTIVLDNGAVVFTSEKKEGKVHAEELLKRCKNQHLVVTSIENKEKAEKPPKLYDLTTLQREANRKLGFTANQTLEYIQSLYEKKLCTYPRTDSRFLTEDMVDILPELLLYALTTLRFPRDEEFDVPCNAQLVIDSSKVTDHHAIIPTKSLANYDIEQLPYGEKAVLTLIMLRLLSALGDNHRYSETVVTAGCGDVVFTTKGKTILQNGFMEYEVLLNLAEKQDEKSLPLMAEGEVIENCNAEMKEGKTSPPKQFTEDTLLLAMETTGKDENIEKEFCGIGTPATRAGIIEKLISVNLLERKGDKKTKYLLPTDKGNALITILPESIQSPLTTAEWEEKLKFIETGDLSANEFLSEISKTTENLVRTYDVVKGSEQLFPSQNKVIGKCPRCGSNVIENKKGFCCENRTCGFALWKENKFFTSKKKTLTEKIVKDLLTTGKCKLTGCYSEKTGKTYNATVSIDETGGKYVNFVLEFEKRG